VQVLAISDKQNFEKVDSKLDHWLCCDNNSCMWKETKISTEAAYITLILLIQLQLSFIKKAKTIFILEVELQENARE